MTESPTEAAQLAGYASALADSLDRHVPEWIRLILGQRAGAVDGSELGAVAERIAAGPGAEVLTEVRRLLETDIDQQWSSPLEIVRRLVPVLSEELRAMGAEPVARDARTIEISPDDDYRLTPATFAEIHADLHEPGLAWGAAKAHVHLKRHADPEPQPIVVVFAPDLGDRTRFDPFVVTHVRSAGKLTEFAESTEPDLVIVDLDRTSAPADFRIDNAHVVGFGSHVDTDRHDDALDAGFDAVMARSVFFRRMPELLAPVAKSQR